MKVPTAPPQPGPSVVVEPRRAKASGEQIRWPRGILGTYVAPASRLGSLESVDVITDQCL